MCKADDEELLAVRSDFCLTVAQWRLTQAEVASLLGVERGWREGVILPDVLDCFGEKRLRLLVRLRRGLEPLMPEAGELAEWLRTGSEVYGGATPLEALADVANLRAVVRVLEGRPSDALSSWPHGS